MKRQKVLFLKENYIFRILKSFIFAGLFIIALLLILVHKIDLGLISGLTKSIIYISSPVLHIATLPAQGLSYSYKKTSEILNIYEENQLLKKENKELYLLKNQLRALKVENQNLKDLLHHFETPEIKSYTARVISQTNNAFSNSLIIYIGSNKDLIKPGYAVVNKSGLIGRIDTISGKYARVTTITDINSKIPVVSQKSRDRGILIGDNSSELKLIFTPLMPELHINDILVTSGIGGGIPADIPVAKIKKIGENIISTPLFNLSEIEIVKILGYDITPNPETNEVLQ